MFLKKLSPIQRNTFWIIVGVIVIKMPLILRDILLVGYFGVGTNADLYFYALVVPMFFSTILSASINYFVIPAYWKVKTDEGADVARQYANTLLVYLSLFLLLITFLSSSVIPHALVKINLINFSSSAEVLFFNTLSIWASLFFFFGVLSAFLISLLQAEHRYTVSIYPQALVPAFSIAAIVLAAKSLGIIAAIIGATVGAFATFVFYYLYSQRIRLIDGFRRGFQRSKIKINHEEFFLLTFACLFPAFTTLIDQQMAGMLGKGKLTIFTYGTRLPNGITEILCVGLGIAVFSHFATWHAENDNQKLKMATQKIILLITIFIIPVCAFMLLFAQPLIILLFERGAFLRSDTLAVAKILSFYAFSIYFAVIATIAAKAISAVRRNNIFLALAFGLSVFRIFANLILIRFFDINGLALSHILTHILNCLLLFYFLDQVGIHIFERAFRRKIFICIIPVLLMLLLLQSVRMLTSTYSPFVSLTTGALVFALFISVIIYTNRQNGLVIFVNNLAQMKNR